MAGNPLRRTSDRIEAWCTTLVLVTLVVAAPMVATLVAVVAYRLDGAAPEWEQHLRGVAAGVATLLCVAWILWGLRAAVRALLDRHRMREWDQRWLEVEPRWSRML